MGSGAKVVILGAPNSVLAACEAIAVAAQAACIKPCARAAVRPDLHCAVLGQAVHSPVVPLKAPTAKHMRVTATGLVGAQAIARQLLAIHP